MAVLSYLAAVMNVADSRQSITVYLPIEASVLVTPGWYYDPNARDVRFENQSLRDAMGLGVPREVPKGVSFV